MDILAQIDFYGMLACMVALFFIFESRITKLERKYKELKNGNQSKE